MTKKIYPEMTSALEGKFIIDVIEDALRFDLLPSSLTHSMTQYCEKPDAVRELFDSIAYNKCK